MPFTLQINADTPDDLKRQLDALAAAFGGNKELAAHIVAAKVTDTGVTALVAPPAEEPAKLEAPLAAQAPDTPPPANVVKELTIEERRKGGTKMLLELFNKNQTVMPQLAALQRKYGVKKFDDIGDDKVPDFYNDALLLVNGTAEVARAA